MAVRDQKRGRGRPRKKTNLFGNWIDKSRFTRDQVATRLEVSRQHLDQLCASTRRPDLERAFRIEKMTKGKVPARFWLKVKRPND